MKPTADQMKEAYDKAKNLKIAAAEIGMKWQTLYWNLKKAGHPVTGDKRYYGSIKDRFGIRAEDDFQRIVPSAKSLNTEKFQAKTDFLVNGLNVEIKASNYRTGRQSQKSSLSP